MHEYNLDRSAPLSNQGRLRRLIADVRAAHPLLRDTLDLEDNAAINNDFLARCVGAAIGLQSVYIRRFRELTGPQGERLRDFQRHARLLARLAAREIPIEPRSAALKRFVTIAVETATATAIACGSLDDVVVGPARQTDQVHLRHPTRSGTDGTTIPITATNPGGYPYASLSS